MKVFVLLPVYNRREVTNRFIQCLKNQTHKNLQLIVLDDGSTDGTSEMVLSEMPEALVVSGSGDWWWAGALQAGFNRLSTVKICSDDFVLIINDDTEFNDDFLENGLSVLSNRRSTFLQAYCYSMQTRKLLDIGIFADWSNFTFKAAIDPKVVNCLSTRGLLFRFSDFLEVGGFYPHLLPHYASDYEFSIRAKKLGFDLISSPEFKLFVDETTTGMHVVGNVRFFGRFKKVFSKKFPSNPIYMSVFVLLACPAKYKIHNLARIWKNALSLLIRGY